MVTLILIFLAGIFSASMDALRFRYPTSIFRFWKNQNWVNPSLSWPNKWKPKSKFGDFIMSTVLVWMTDFWHFCKFMMLLLMTGAIVFYHPIINWWGDILLIYSIFTVIFELFFSKILIKKK